MSDKLIFDRIKTSRNIAYKFIFTIVLAMLAFSAVAKTYYVSNSGNDANLGTSPGNAWKTLDKVNSFTPSPGDQILFRRGDEWVGTLIVNASGTEVNPIVYGAYGDGSKPKIYGSEKITGWELHEGNIYKAKLSLSEINQLFVNEKRMTLARFPNSGYFNTTKVYNPTSFFSNDLINTSIDYTGATWVGRTSAFTMFSKKVISSNTQVVTIDSKPYDGSLAEGKGFFLCDKLEFIDSPGEWYYEESTNTIYFWAPDNQTPDNYVIRGSINSNGIIIENANNISVQGFEIMHSSVNGIKIDSSDYVVVEDNRIISPDLVGIHIPSPKSVSAKLINNYIYQANGGGIRCFSPSATILDNTIEETGQLENINKSTYQSYDNFGTAIYSRSDNPTISYNRLINTGYCGINWKGKNGNISYNYINGACQVLDDGGGIYTYNGYDYKEPGSAGSTVNHNIVLNVFGNPEGYENDYFLGFGIYIDNAIHHVTIENNLIAGATGAIFLNPSGFITIKNNTIMDATLLLLIHDEFDDNVISNNIFYTTKRKGFFKWWGEGASQRIVYQESGASAKFDYNTYVAHYGNDNLFVNTSDFAKWKSTTRQDINSTFDGSPLLVGESEKLFYNDTKDTISLQMGSRTFKDIYGNILSGKVTLPPFTSKIIIGKNLELINKSPIASNTSFRIQRSLKKNDIIGTIPAYDTDQLQKLSYAFVKGNHEWFTIDETTGEISAIKNIEVGIPVTHKLLVQVSDDALFPLSTISTAEITLIPELDEQPPLLTSFIIPEKYHSFKMPVIELTATDNRKIAGYSITQSSAAPETQEWQSSIPDSFFFLEEGLQTIYAWAIDSAGNVSTPLSSTVNINVIDTIEVIQNVEICEGSEHNNWTKTGVYIELTTLNPDTVQKKITYLTVNPQHVHNEDVTISEGDNYLNWTESGQYQRTLQNIYGCDSIVTTNLTVLQPVFTHEEIFICEGEDYLGWNESGQYSRTLSAGNGADSIITTNLWVEPTILEDVTITITEGENYNGQTETGVYEYTYQAVSGCDSVIIIHLYVNQFFDAPSYFYWSREGRYKRKSTEIKAFAFDNLKSNVMDAKEIRIYPNPVKDYLFLEFQMDQFSETQLQILDSNGKILVSQNSNTTNDKLDLRNLSAGIYYVRVKNTDTELIKKIIKH